MKPPKKTADLMKSAMPAYIVLAVVYVLLILLLPADPVTLRTYDLSSAEYHIMLLAIALPSLAVWLGAFIGYAKLTEYANSIRRTPEGPHFGLLAKGSMWLAWSLPISAISLLILSGIDNVWPHLHAPSIIIGNYISLLLPLIAFTFIGSASRELVSDSKLKISHSSSRGIMLFFALAGVLYCFLTFNQFDLSTLSSTANPYYLPIWLAVLTVTVPYLYTWFVGLLAAYEIGLFRRNVRGVLYKQALGLLASGLIAVIISLIALQYLNGIAPRVGHLVLNYKIPLTILFRILGGVGFVMIALGANRLKKIEEV